MPLRFFARPEVTELVLRPADRRAATIHLMEGHSLISTDIVASYAADAALEIEGVRRLVDGSRPRHHGVKVDERRRRRSQSSSISARLGREARRAVGIAVQQRVAEYLGRMTDLETATVDVSSTTSDRRRKAA